MGAQDGWTSPCKSTQESKTVGEMPSEVMKSCLPPTLNIIPGLCKGEFLNIIKIC